MTGAAGAAATLLLRRVMLGPMESGPHGGLLQARFIEVLTPAMHLF